MTISVGVPTIRPQNLLLCLSPILQNQINGSSIKEILIVDSTNKNLPHIVELLIGALREEGIEVKLIKQNKQGIGLARKTIIENTKTDYLLMIDDDVVISPNTITELKKTLDNNITLDFAVPMLFNPNDNLLKKWFGDKYIPSFPTKEELISCKKMSTEDSYYKSMFFHNSLFLKEYTSSGNGACIMLRINGIDRDVLERLGHKDWGEDRFITGCLDSGMVVRTTYAWHLLDVTQERRWKPSELEVLKSQK